MSPQSFTIEEVHEIQSGGASYFRVHLRRDDGLLHGYAFPADTIVWRAAELGLDPEDVDTILDVVLHEPFITTAANPTTETRSQARAVHLARVTDAKSRVVIHQHPQNARTADPLDIIRRHTTHPDRIREIHAIVNGGARRHRQPPLDGSAARRHRESNEAS
jgi:hypothetical protein